MSGQLNLNDDINKKNIPEINPDEASDYEYIAEQILAHLDTLSPAGFEQLVTDLLIKMGYEVFQNARRKVSSSAIQGIIIEDRPGFRPIYFQTRKLEKGAYIAICLLGSASKSACQGLTGEICNILQRDYGIDGANVYITYHPTDLWGWNGGMF